MYYRKKRTMPKRLFFKLLFVILISQTVNSQAQEINLLPSNINKTDTNVNSPYISYDGNSIVFIVKTQKKDFVAESKKDLNGNWKKPKYIDAINYMDSGIFYIESPSYNQNASEIYFAKRNDNKDSVFNIWYTKKINNNWSKPIKMPAPINSGANESDPCISPDGKTFYFVRDFVNESLKKFECKTMYVSHLYDGKWSNPAELPAPVNSGCDRNPRIAADGKSLYFSSLRNIENKNSDIFYTKLITKNAWITPVRDTLFNTLFDEFSPCYDADNQNMYFSRISSDKKTELERIYYAPVSLEFKPEKTVIVSGIITDLNTNLPIPAKIDIIDPYSSIILYSITNNSETGEYSYILGIDRTYKIDIYNENYSHSFSNFDPKISPETKIKRDIKLYNSVNIILNVFDNEIYEPLEGTIKIIDTKTGEIQDVKPTETDKGRYSLKLNIGKNYKIEVSKKHYITNNFELALTDVVQFSEFEKDIELQINKIEYELSLSDSETGAGVTTTVEITNLTTNERTIITATTDENGKLKLSLRDGNRYEISVTPNGYGFANATVDLIDEFPETKSEIKLQPLKKETKIELSDINFEFNSAVLNESSFVELDRVTKLLEKNPNIKIEISAHTDDVGSDIYNLKLSDKRAQSVVQYLIEKNISKEKLIAKGYGKRKPAYFPVDSEENRAKNRRVEMKIIEL